MLQTETVIINGLTLTHTYSDEGFKIQQIQSGAIYDEAYDIPNKYTYLETAEPLDPIDPPAEEETEQPEENNENTIDN